MLLHDVAQFVSKQMLTVRGMWRIPRSQNDSGANRVCPRIDRLSGCSGSFIGVKAHLAKVPSKARLKVCSRCRVERLPGGV